MKKVLVIVGLLIATIAGISIAYAGTPVGTTVKPVQPHIEDGTFSMKIKTINDVEVYPTGLRFDCNIPYAFDGEALELWINVSDPNGEQDLVTGNAEVKFYLFKDNNTDQPPIEIKAGVVASSLADSDNDTATFYASYTVPKASIVKGDYYIYVYACDSGSLEADNANVYSAALRENLYYTGVHVFLNPTVAYSINVSSIQFGQVGPGDVDVPSLNNTVGITNADPDNVGMKIGVGLALTPLVKAGSDWKIDPSNIDVDTVAMNGTALHTEISAGAPDETASLDYEPTLANSEVVLNPYLVKSGMSISVNFFLDVPMPLASGDYTGTLTIYAHGF